jgi:hypothetical protein
VPPARFDGSLNNQDLRRAYFRYRSGAEERAGSDAYRSSADAVAAA